MQAPRPCPKCGEYGLYRSHSKNIIEQTIKRTFPLKIYRCHACDWRGLLSKRRMSGKQSVIKSLAFYIVIILVAVIVSLILKGMLS
ncbi:MAG: hypothetical protein ABIL68_13310 [bacterium]